MARDPKKFKETLHWADLSWTKTDWVLTWNQPKPVLFILTKSKKIITFKQILYKLKG